MDERAPVPHFPSSPGTRLTRRRPAPMALEQRFMFDGAMVATAAAMQLDAAPAQAAAAADGPHEATVLAAGAARAQGLVAEYLAAPGADRALATDFAGTADAASRLSAARDLLRDAAAGSLSVRVELLDGAALQGALGAFATRGPDGAPVIFLNRDWLHAGASADAVARVLVEEMGHALDARLDPADDTAGDEGDAFARRLLGMVTPPGTTDDADQRTITVAGQALAVEASATNLGIVQTFIVPMPETNIQTALDTINSAVNNQIWAVISATTTSNGVRIVYDHWEDGYETDLNNPVQATTEVWGDGDLTNGVAPGSTNDVLTAGQVLTLRNLVDLSRVGQDTNTSLAGNQYYHDGRDRLAATAPISLVRAGWADTPGTVLAGAVNVYDIGNAGSTFVVPIGQNVVTQNPDTTTNRLFEYTSLHIVATDDATRVRVDRDGNGTFDITQTLQRGETLFVNGNVLAGARVVADDANGTNTERTVSVYSIAGDTGSSYENRWFALPPTEQWGSSYYAPVYTTNTAAQAMVFLYNPGSTAITVLYDTMTARAVPVTVAAGGTAFVSMPSTASGAHFHTADGSTFYAVSTIDSGGTGNQNWDWSYSLVAEDYLTTRFVVGWAPGNGNLSPSTAANGSPVWVTATAATTLHVDYDGDGTADTTIAVQALQSVRIFDPDRDQSGMSVWTTDGTLLAAAWGQDPSVAGTGTPFLDMGYTVMPFPDYVMSKTSVEVGGDGDGNVELGEQVQYTITVANRALVPLFDVRLSDVMQPAGVAGYVDGSLRLRVVDVRGNVLLDVSDTTQATTLEALFTQAGLLVDDMSAAAGDQGLLRGATLTLTYRMQLPTAQALTAAQSQALAAVNYRLVNSASLNGVSDPSIVRVTSQPVQLVVNSDDGLITLSNSNAYSGSTQSIAEGAALFVQVTDADGNRNTAAVETLSVQVVNLATGETENLTLTETGANTGVFRASIATSAASSAATTAGVLQVTRGQQLAARYTDPVWGGAFDNPVSPGTATDTDGDIATGNANVATVGVTTPVLTKVLYLSDDSANNLDRISPVATNDTTTALTGAIAPATVAPSVTIVDDFNTNTSGGGSGWSTNWLATTNVPVTATGGSTPNNGSDVRLRNNVLEIRGSGVTAYRTFAALAGGATMSFTLAEQSTRPLEAGDTVVVEQFVGGAWAQVTSVDGANIGTTAATFTGNLSNGATAIRFRGAGTFDTAANNGDRVYVDNLKITAGGLSTANDSGSSLTVNAIPAGTALGQTFTVPGTGLIDVSDLRLDLGKSSSSASGTATVSIRSTWDGTALWTGTVDIAQLSASGFGVTLSGIAGVLLDRGQSYVLRVDAVGTGLIWQGNGVDTYAGGNALTSAGTPATGDLQFTLDGEAAQRTSARFTQALSMATDFVMPAGGTFKIVTHVSGVTGLAATGSAVSATLSAGGSVFATVSTPVYDSVAGTLTWTGTLTSARTIAAGEAVTLAVTNAATGSSFRIAYDSTTAPSRIELPTVTVIEIGDADPTTAGVQEVGFFTAPAAKGGGQPVAAGAMDAGGVVYVRVRVSDPFGDYDVTGLQLVIDGPGSLADLNLSLNDAYVVDQASDGRAWKTYEYAWQTAFVTGAYAVRATAAEGFEGTIDDTATRAFQVTAADVGTPSTTTWLNALSTQSVPGGAAGARYATGATPFLRVTDLDQTMSSSVQVQVTVNGTAYTVILQATGTAGIFEADLTQAATHGGNAAAAAAFAALPAGGALVANYVDPDDANDTSADTIGVNRAPDAVNDSRGIGSDRAVSGNLVTGLSGVGTDSDPDGHVVTITAVNGSTAGVGTTITLPSGARLTLLPDGGYVYDPRTLTSPPTVGTPRTDSFTYTVSDGNGGTDTATASFTVNYVNPDVVPNQTGRDGETTALDVAGAFDAWAGVNEVVYSVTGLPAGLMLDPDTGLITGTVVRGASQTGGGSYAVTVTGTQLDPNTGLPTSTTTTRSFTWTVTNVAPVAANDTATTPEDTAVTGNLLANDADGGPDSDTLSVSALSIDTDNDGTPNTITASGGLFSAVVAGKGTLVVTAATGAWTFTPAANWNGTLPVTSYSASDGNGGTATATLAVTVTPVNDPPVAVNDTRTTAEDTPLVITPSSLTTNDTDPDGDTLSIVSVGNATNGTVRLVGGNVVFTPAANYSGPASFRYTVTDGRGGTSTATVNVTVTAVNDVPVAVNDTRTTPEDTPQVSTTASLLANDTDADGNPLTITAVGNAVNGTVSLVGGNIIFTPTPNHTGPASYTYTVSDGNGGTATATVNVNVTPVNDPPVAVGNAYQTTEDTLLTGTNIVTDAGTGGTDSDTEGGVLTLATVNGAAFVANGTDPAHLASAGWMQVMLANGTLFVKVDGSMAYRPAADGIAGDSFTYAVSDGQASSTAATVSISVSAVQDPPVAVNDTRVTPENTPLVLTPGSLSGNDTDPDGDPLTVVSVGSPVNGTVTLVGGVLTFTPVPGYSGPASFTYTVSDGNGGTATATVNVTVTAVNAPPTGTPDTATTPAGTPLVLPLPPLVTNDRDPDGDPLVITHVTAVTGGSVTLGPSGIVFVPAPGFAGTARFTYTIDDGQGGTTEVPVTVDVTALPAPVMPPQTVPSSTPAPTAPGGPASMPMVRVAPFDSSLVVPSTALAPAGVPETVAGRPQDLGWGELPREERVWKSLVMPAETPSLRVFAGMPDQFVEMTKVQAVTVPMDAFVHTKANARVTLEARTADGKRLPGWIRFDGDAGVFTVDGQAGAFRGEFVVKLSARDDEGREATTLFRLSVGDTAPERTPASVDPAPAPAPGRAGLAEKLRAQVRGARVPVEAPQRPQADRALQPADAAAPAPAEATATASAEGR